MKKEDIYFVVGNAISVLLYFIVTLINIFKSHPYLVCVPLTIFVITSSLYYVHKNAIKFIDLGLDFFKKELDSYIIHGGRIFTTALFESYSKGDDIKNKLKESTIHKKLIIERFVFLDDPTLEFKWIKEFLELDGKENLTPIIYRIASEERTIIRKLSGLLPKFSITLFYNSDGKIKKAYLGFPTSLNGFGFCTYNRLICKAIEKNVSQYKENAEKIESIDTIYSADKNIGVTTRIVSAIEEVAIKDDTIKYFGIFGSQGLLFQNKLSLTNRHELDGDLDIILVVSPEIDFDEFKSKMSKLIKEQFNSESETFSIEWSNLEGKYYERRRPFHIDIQLHRKSEQYYLNRKLLGYSIFDNSIYTVYSQGNESIFEHIPYPKKAIRASERIDMALNDIEYGLITAYNRLGSTGYQKTDPKRILWIMLQNYIWAVTGYRPREKELVFEYLKTDTYIFPFISNQVKSCLKEIYLDSNSDTSISNKDTKTIINFLIEDLKKCLK